MGTILIGAAILVLGVVLAAALIGGARRVEARRRTIVAGRLVDIDAHANLARAARDTHRRAS